MMLKNSVADVISSGFKNGRDGAAIFRNLSPELTEAVLTISKECKKHELNCKGCPFWLNDGTVAQRCGLNVYEGRVCYYPSEWSVYHEKSD